MSEPWVSVILCCYNQAPFVEKAVRSVLDQTYRNVELVAIDNGSTDGSAEILRDYTNHPRVRVCLFPNNDHVTRRLNGGIALARGEFVSILYADDYYLPNMVEDQLDCFKTLGPEYGVVFSPGYRKNIKTGEQWQPPGLTCSGNILRQMIETFHETGYINPISALSRKQCFIDFPFREELFQEAEAIYMRIAMKYQFHYYNTPTVLMQDHPSNLGKAVERNSDTLIYLLEKLGEEPLFPAPLLPSLKKMKAKTLRNHSWQAIRSGVHATWVVKRLARSVQLNPKQLTSLKTWASLGLCATPEKLRRRVNQLGFAITRPKENVELRTEY